MTIREAYQLIILRIQEIYDKSESGNIADLIMEKLAGAEKTKLIITPEKKLNDEKIVLLQEYITRLINNEPVQYILNEAWFYNLRLYVDNNVLIPRPETEELVEWVLNEVGGRKTEVRKILDIGTGSGCIAIALKKYLPPEIDLWACDSREQILAIARKNANDIGVKVDFTNLDFLDEKQRTQLPQFDFIVSNPPYVPMKDKVSMKANVVSYEPHSALFVPDNDPLIFYNSIADFANEKLNDGGAIFVELHEELSNPVAGLFKSKGYPVTELRKDMQGKVRMLKAAR